MRQGRWLPVSGLALSVTCGDSSGLLLPAGAESRPLSLAPLASSPKGGANGGSRLGPSFVQPLRLALLASSPSRGAFGKEVSSQRNGELAGLSATPEPPLLGEVALRSNDGEGGFPPQYSRFTDF